MWARPTSHTPRRLATQSWILSRDQGNQPVKIKNHPPHTIWQDWSWIGSISGGKPPGCINLHPTQSMYISKWIQNTQASSLCKNYLRTSYLKYTVKIHDVPTNKQHESPELWPTCWYTVSSQRIFSTDDKNLYFLSTDVIFLINTI